MSEYIPVLSICVPTYNRSAHLRECLLSIIRSVENASAHIEILISDNASTDETFAVAQEFQAMSDHVRYHRHPENIGAEPNFRAAAEMASGKYIWIIGDDDRLTLDAVRIVLHHIEAGFDLIACNFSQWSRDFLLMKSPSYYSLKQDLIFEAPDQLLNSLDVGLAFISAVIVKRSLFIGVDRLTYDRFFEYGLSFLYSVYTCLMPHGRSLYVAAPIVQNRLGNAVISDWYKVFVLGASEVFRVLALQGYSARSILRAQNRVLRIQVINVIFYHGILYQGSIRKTIQFLWPYYRTNWRFWVMCVPALLVPRSLVELARGMVRGTRDLRSWVLRLLGKSGHLPVRGRPL